LYGLNLESLILKRCFSTVVKGAIYTQLYCDCACKSLLSKRKLISWLLLAETARSVRLMTTSPRQGCRAAATAMTLLADDTTRVRDLSTMRLRCCTVYTQLQYSISYSAPALN